LFALRRQTRRALPVFFVLHRFSAAARLPVFAAGG
jgi:hypothetical protein